MPIALIVCLGVIVYSNTFHAPFQFDDKIFIIDNLAIRNIADLRHIWGYMPCRFLTFFSFALNYHFHQLNVSGYHLVNLAVHLVSAILVWWLTLLTFSCPAMKEEKIARHANVIALFAGLVFVSHPLQTEAVTYIWQRTASMATMFYLASLCFYVKSRTGDPAAIITRTGDPAAIITRTGDPAGRPYYILSLITAVAAMFTKEIAVTLPLILALYDFYFFDETIGKRCGRLVPFFIIALIIPLTLLTASVNGLPMRGVAPQQPSSILPLHYFLTQFRVMATYIRLIFLPLNQNLDYDYPIFKNIFELPVFISILFLITVFYRAKRLFSKYRLVSFSIFWFFLTLLPESSFLPLQDVIFEHRLYLPLAGFSMFLASGVYYLTGKTGLKTMVKVLALIIACYSVLTYQRNKVWENELDLWNDAERKSPHKARPCNNRGLAMARRGNLAAAIADYGRAIEIDPRYLNPYVNRGFLYNEEGDFTRALSDYNSAIGLNPKLAEAYNNRGNIYFKLGNLTRAIADYSKAVELKPDYENAYFNLGFTCYKQGNLARAISSYHKAIELNPKDTQARNNLAVCYSRLK